MILYSLLSGLDEFMYVTTFMCDSHMCEHKHLLLVMLDCEGGCVSVLGVFTSVNVVRSRSEC